LSFNSLKLNTLASLTIEAEPNRLYRIEYADAFGNPDQWQFLTNVIFTTSP